jgi:peroxiredoxin
VVLVKALLLAASCLSACAAAPVATPGRLPATTLDGIDGKAHALGGSAVGGGPTVVVFFTKDCPIVRAHDGRLRELYARYKARGVSFYAVDSDAAASLAEDAAEAKARGYAFPVLLDKDGRLARALGAEQAGYTVVADASGRVRYRGAIDSDRTHMTSDASHYLDGAIASVLAGREPSPRETPSLGCPIRR